MTLLLRSAHSMLKISPHDASLLSVLAYNPARSDSLVLINELKTCDSRRVAKEIIRQYEGHGLGNPDLSASSRRRCNQAAKTAENCLKWAHKDKSRAKKLAI